MDLALLDTDIPSESLKGFNPLVVRHAAAYLAQHGQFAFSAAARYQILLGLKEKQASRQLENFEGLCQKSIVLPVSNVIFDRASDLWAEARRTGHPPRSTPSA